MHTPFDRDFALPGSRRAPAAGPQAGTAAAGPQAGTAPNREVYTVGRLNDEVARLLEDSFPLVWVEGELTNLARPRSGHMYFTLKDSRPRCAARSSVRTGCGSGSSRGTARR